MNILFIHQNFPGQFVHLAAYLANDQNNTVFALTLGAKPPLRNIHIRPYQLIRSASQETHFLLKENEAHVLRGEACASAALQLKHEGFVPDVIVAHPGWGEALFIKDVFPQAKLVIYCEYYYAAEGQDVGFDPEQSPLTFAQRCQLRLKNTTNLLSLEIADIGISPTQWQKSTYPVWAQKKIDVIHDGIDLSRLAFNPNAHFDINTKHIKTSLRPGDEVLTYVARNLEPVRGFHIFMRTLPSVLSRCPNAQIVVVGGDDISYGNKPENGKSWKEYMLQEVGDIDLRRVHFTGQITYENYLNLLNVSRVHSYWTTPFVLSWSFLEAALSGTQVLASNTAPVTEFSDELGVKTFEFFSHLECAEEIITKLNSKPNKNVVPKIPRILLHECLSAQNNLLTSLR